MSAIGLLIVGAIILIISYYIPPAPPPVKVILNIVGWICIAVGLILLIAFLIGIPLAAGGLR